MKEDFISLNFALESAVRLCVGDYINDEKYGLYILTKDYLPVYNQSTGGYDYSVQFDAYYYSWNNKLLKLNPEDTASELSFDYTRSIDQHAGLIRENLKSLGLTYHGQSFELIIEQSLIGEPKHISYQNIFIVDAMSLIAETFECEWWVVDNIIYFGKCYKENGFEFEIGKSAETMTPSNSGEEAGNRLYAFGSEKNLPRNYRQTSGVVNGIVQKKLMLPEGVPFIDTKEGLTKETAIEFVKVFEDIYPKTDGTITTLLPPSYITNEEGNKQIIYSFKDDSIRFSNEYRLVNEDLIIHFESGKLEGLDFVLIFNPKNLPEKNSDGTWNEDAQVFEIVVSNDYAEALPNEILCPQEGDKYILLNWDSTKIEDLGLVAKAEAELLEAAKEYLSEISVDNNIYTCNMMSDVAEAMYMGNIKSLLNIGDSVILKNAEYFQVEGFRESRIIGYEYKLDYPFDTPVYIVGDKPKYSRLKNIEEKLDSIVYAKDVEKTFGTGNDVYVLSRNDNTPASDSNVYSALRSQLEFLRKNADDTAKGHILFEKGLEAYLISILEQIVVKTAISSPSFANGVSGWRINWENGLSELEIDNLRVRQTMSVVELLIQRMRSVGGSIIVSSADGKIKEIEEAENEYKLFFEQENTYRQYDLIRCQTFTGASIKSYWVEVDFADNRCVTIKKSEFDGYSLPAVGDETVLLGSAKNTKRQNAIIISATEDGQPRIDILDGIKSKSLEGCLRTRLGNLDGIIDGQFGTNQPHGDGLYSDNVFLKGNFVLSSRNESVETMFSITEDGIKSSMESLQTEAIKGKTLLYNASFIDGLKGWITSNTDSTYFSGTSLLFASGSMLAQSVTVSNEPVYDNVFFVNIKNGWIKQSNLYFVNKPEFEADKQYPLFFSVNVRCNVAGTLVVKVGDEEIYNAEIPQSDKFVTIDVDKLTWNGQGDFYLEFTGVADFYGLTIYTEKTEVLHKTFFDMSDRLIHFGAQQLDESGEIKKESGIVVQPEGAGLYAKDGNGNQSRIATYADGKVVLEGSEIQLKGNLTADGKFKVREDGSIEAKNALFNGFVQKGTYYITDENKLVFFTVDELNQNNWSAEISTLSPIIVLKFTEANKKYIRFTLPGYDIRTSMAATLTLEDLAYIRSFIGSEIFIYNYTENECRFDFVDRTGNKGVGAYPIGKGEFIQFKCNFEYWSTSDWQGEFIYWEVVHTGKAIPIANN